MVRLLKELFELWIRSCWLRKIEKAINKNNRLNARARRQRYIVEKLMKEYNKIYGEYDVQISYTNYQNGEN